MKGLAAGFFEPRDIRNVFQPLQHLLILFDGENDRDGFAAAGDYLWFFGQRTHERSITDSGCGVNLRSTFGKFRWRYGLFRGGEALLYPRASAEEAEHEPAGGKGFGLRLSRGSRGEMKIQHDCQGTGNGAFGASLWLLRLVGTASGEPERFVRQLQPDRVSC